MDQIASSEFVKVNDELGIVFGFAIICEDDEIDGADKRYFDLHGDHIPEGAMLKASADFMLSHRAGKIMHRGDVVGDIVFAWPQTREIADEFGETCRKFGLKIGWKPRDAALLKEFKPGGSLTGFSIGGDYGEIEEIPDA